MNTFRGVERLIYEFIISHCEDLSNLSAKQVASETITTTTSVNRVCKKMGYNSYTELRYKLALDLKTQSPLQHEQAPQQKEQQIAQALKDAPVVYLYARGASLVSINYLSRFLSLANIPHLAITDIHQLTSVNKGTLLLISKSGETNAVIDMAHNAKRKGMKVFSLTYFNSTLSQVCQVNIDLHGQVDGISLYNRESQIEILQTVDEIGKNLLL